MNKAIVIIATLALSSCTPPVLNTGGVSTKGKYTGLKYTYNPVTGRVDITKGGVKFGSYVPKTGEYNILPGK